MQPLVVVDSVDNMRKWINAAPYSLESRTFKIRMSSNWDWWSVMSASVHTKRTLVDLGACRSGKISRRAPGRFSVLLFTPAGHQCACRTPMHSESMQRLREQKYIHILVRRTVQPSSSTCSTISASSRFSSACRSWRVPEGSASKHVQ